jgi:hypothetical protein
MYQLADLLLSPTAGANDDIGGLKWLKAAAEAGQTAAQTRLAQDLATGGNGAARDDVAAAAWAQKSAFRDDHQAAALLCRLYARGLNGQPPDGAIAFRWCSAAADSGVPAAIIALARLYLDGTGTKRDAMSALTWATIGSTRGNPAEQQDAAKLRATAASLLSPAEQQVAQTRADTWHPLP